MLNFSEGSVQIVAEDSRQALSDIDRACLANLRMASSIIETFDGAGVPVGMSQRIHRAMASSFSKIVEGRGEVVSAMAQLLVVKDKSNQAETDVGCGGWRVLLQGDAKNTPVAENA